MARDRAAPSLPDAIRDEFPILRDCTYLNSCSQGALSKAVRRAFGDYLDDWGQEGSPWEYWVEKGEAARTAFASLIGANPDAVAVTTSVSAGVSALASGLRYDGERSKIVLTDFEFPTIGQIWHAQELRGATVEHVSAEANATIPLEHFDEAIDDRTLLVSITHVCFRNGSRLAIEEVIRMAHERGAMVLLDSYQAIGTVPIDVRSLGVDFLVAGTVKYLLGSAGLGFLYCRPDLVEAVVPTATGWFADADIFEMDVHDYSPSPTARRFESGTPPIPNLYAGLAGIELVMDIGVGNIKRHVQELNRYLIEGVDQIGGRVVTPREPDRRSALVAIASTDEQALVAALGDHGIVTSSRDGNLRISTHGYSSLDDIDAALEVLTSNRELLVQ